MTLPIQQRLAAGLAVVMTGAGLVMVAAAALERAGTPLDKLLLTLTAVGLALGAHLLPALAQRRVLVWLLWLGCLMATLYGHAHFFAAANERAGQQRAQQVNTPHATAALQAQLAATQARPQAVVAADVATATARIAQAEAALARCQHNNTSGCATSIATLTGLRAKASALQEELAQSRQASLLRERLASAAQTDDQMRAWAAADPIDRALASLTGLPPTHVGLGAVAMQALLLELLAATLWALALPGINSKPAATTSPLLLRAKPSQTVGVHGGWASRPGLALAARAHQAVRTWLHRVRAAWVRLRSTTKPLASEDAQALPRLTVRPSPQNRDGPGSAAPEASKTPENRAEPRRSNLATKRRRPNGTPSPAPAS